MIQTFDLSKMGLVPMDEFEMQAVDGGDTGYYGKGVDLSLAVCRISYAAHQFGDFILGFWDAVVK